MLPITAVLFGYNTIGVTATSQLAAAVAALATVCIWSYLRGGDAAKTARADEEKPSFGAQARRTWSMVTGTRHGWARMSCGISPSTAAELLRCHWVTGMTGGPVRIVEQCGQALKKMRTSIRESKSRSRRLKP